MTESKTKKCEICGEIKPIADFSKSYRNRCKQCVAEMSRKSRIVSQMMKKPKDSEYKTARIKATGEVVKVRPIYGTAQLRVALFKTKDGRDIPQVALQFETEINWEQRRYEIAKAALQGLCANDNEQMITASPKLLAEWAEDCANALVETLKAHDNTKE